MTNRSKRRALKQRLTLLRREQSKADRICYRVERANGANAPLRALLERSSELLQIINAFRDQVYLTERNSREWRSRSTPARWSVD